MNENVEYTVIIKKTEKNVPFKNKEYQVIKKAKDEDSENEYGYVFYDDTQDVTTNIFEQTVGHLDVQGVIKAVNLL